MKYRCTLTIFFGVLLVTLTSCQNVTPNLIALDKDEFPKSYSMFSDKERKLGPWWNEFGSSELDQLIRQAASDNLTIKEARARLHQFQHLARETDAAKRVSVDWEAGTRHGRQRSERLGETKVEEYSLGLTGSYEVDLWGRLDNASEAALTDIKASREDIKTAGMTITARIAEVWLQMISERAQRKLLEKQLTTNQEVLKVLEQRMAKTTKTNLVQVLQQRAAIEEVKTKIPLSLSREAILRNELATLLGKAPGCKLPAIPDELPSPAPLPATGVPTDLLASRPDVVAAGLRLRSESWRIAAAEADRLPKLKLTGALRFASGDLDALLDEWILSLAANLTGPFLDGGRRKAEVDRLRAVADERLQAYRRVVLTSIREVEDALARERHQQDHIAALRKQIAATKATLKQARIRYLSGSGDFLSVLTSRVSADRLEQTMIQRETELLLYRVALYRALGGPWIKGLIKKGEK